MNLIFEIYCLENVVFAYQEVGQMLLFSDLQMEEKLYLNLQLKLKFINRDFLSSLFPTTAWKVSVFGVCPFWSIFTHIRADYGEIISPYSARMRVKNGLEKLRIRTLLTQWSTLPEIRKNMSFYLVCRFWYIDGPAPDHILK